MLQNGNRLPQQALCYTDADSLMLSESNPTCRVYLNSVFYALYTPDDVRKDYKPLKIFGQENAVKKMQSNAVRKKIEKNVRQGNEKQYQSHERNGRTEHEI